RKAKTLSAPVVVAASAASPSGATITASATPITTWLERETTIGQARPSRRRRLGAGDRAGEAMADEVDVIGTCRDEAPIARMGGPGPDRKRASHAGGDLAIGCWTAPGRRWSAGEFDLAHGHHLDWERALVAEAPPSFKARNAPREDHAQDRMCGSSRGALATL